jgi:four helix bundle protein
VVTIQSYRDLDVWKLAMDYTASVYGLTVQLPKQEMYGLVSQLQRACVSIPSNIAEGHSRKSTRDFLRFISYAMSSLAESETQLILTQRLHEIKTEHLLTQADTLGRKLRALEKSLENKVTSMNPNTPQPPASSPQSRN